MQTKFDLAKIVLVEIPDTLKARNREERAGYEPQTGYRIVISFSDGDTLSDKENEILSRVTDEKVREKMRQTILKNRTQIRYSGVFTADDLDLDLGDGKTFKTPKGGLTDEQQTKLEGKLREYFESLGNTSVFSVLTESVSALLKGTKYEGTEYLEYENADGAVVRISEQSKIFYGVFTDTESATNMLRNNLLRRIDDGDLNVPTETKADTKTADDLGL